MKIKKFLSMLIVLLMLQSSLPARVLAADARRDGSGVVSVTVGDVYVTENKDGVFDSQLEFFFYDITPDQVRVELSNGEVYEGDGEYIRSLFGDDVQWDSEQDLGFPFEIGENEAYFRLFGNVYYYSVYVEEGVMQPKAVSVVTDPVVLTQWYDGVIYEGFGFYYETAPSHIVITYDDESVLEGSYDELKSLIDIQKTDPQDNNEPLVVGNNTGVLTVDGGNYEYQIVLCESENPYIIEMDPDWVYLTDRDGVWDETMGANRYDVRPGHIVIYLASGERLEGSYDELKDELGLEIHSPQDSGEPLKIGEANYAYIESPFAKSAAGYSVYVYEFVQGDDVVSFKVCDITIPQYSTGYYSNITDERIYYRYNVEPRIFELTYEDGTTDVVNGNDALLEKYGWSVHIYTDQDGDVFWELGDHEAYFEVLDKAREKIAFSGEVTVTIIENDFDHLEVKPWTIFEGDGRHPVYVLEDETVFCEYIYSIPVTAVMKNGDRVDLDGQYLEYRGALYDKDIYDGQYAQNQWGVGEHPVTVWLGGKSAQTTVKVIENPVERVDFRPITLRKGIDCVTRTDGDGNEYQHYLYDPEATVIYKGWDKVYGTNGGSVTIGGCQYRITDYSDNQETEHWGPGVHEVEASFLGYKGKIEITVVETDVDELAIADDGEYFTLTFKGGEEDDVYTVFKAEVIGKGSDGVMTVKLRTNRDVTMFARAEFDQTESGVQKVASGLTLTIGGLESNKLDFSPTFKKLVYIPFFDYALAVGAKYPEFKGYTPGEYDRDRIIDLAVNFAADFGKAAKYVPEEGFLMATPAMVLDAVEEVFGITDLEIDRCTGLNPRCGNIRVDLIYPVHGNKFKFYSLCQAPGAPLTYYGYTYPDFDTRFDKCKVSFDERIHVSEIAYLTDEDFVSGDVDLDGDVTMKDVLIMRRYIAGLDELTDAQIAAGDFDGDQEITMKDVLRARRIIAGLD